MGRNDEAVVVVSGEGEVCRFRFGVSIKVFFDDWGRHD